MTKRKHWRDQGFPGRPYGSRNNWYALRLCLRCHDPFWASRWDAITCSVKCRVWIHRHPGVLRGAARLARGRFPASPGEMRGDVADNPRYVVGQWMHFLADQLINEGKDPEMAFEMIARAAA